MGIAGIDTVGAAFVAGLVTSLHCVGMCGPLVCALVPGGSGAHGGLSAGGALYHAGRMVSYGCIGALVGLLGAGPLSFVSGNPGVIASWALVAFLIFISFGIEQKLPRPLFLTRWLGWVRNRALAMRGGRRALLLGIGTPLLPCGPLYLLFGVALTSGSAVKGAELALAFGLGTLPLLWLAHAGFGIVKHRWTPKRLQVTQQVVALLAAAVMVWRLWGTLWFVEGGGPGCCQ